MDNSYLLSKINGALHYAYLTPRSSSRAFLSIFTIFSILLVFINIVTGAGITSTSCLVLCTQAEASRKATEFIWSTLHRKHTRGVEWHFKAQNTEVTFYRLYIYCHEIVLRFYFNSKQDAQIIPTSNIIVSLG